MKNFGDKQLGSFGEDYELKVLKQIIGNKEKKGKKFRRDINFGLRILPIISAEHFTHNLAKRLVVFIKNYYNKYNSIPYYDTIKSVIKAKVSDEMEVEMVFQYLKDIEDVSDEDYTWVQEHTINFINTKNLQRAWDKITREYINRGKYAKYPEIAQIMQNAIVSTKEEERLEAFVAGDYTDMEEGERHPIPTKIPILDDDMNGGLAYGELGIVVAGMKTGKTTFASIAANNAALAGYNVLQIFFEDTEEQIKLKHRSKFSGVNLSAVTNKRNRKSVKRKSDTKLKKIRDAGGCLVVHKMDSTDSTVEDIKNVILNAKEKGVWFQDTEEYEKISFDLVLIDYLDCIKPKGHYKDDWGGDKEVIRDIEKLCSRKHGLNFACWTFTQGGRSSLNSELVNTNDTGGSIKKLQVAHFIMSFAKTMEQRPEGKGTIAILGSRIGRDGIVYKDCTFDNATLTIEIEQEDTLANFVNNNAFVEETD